MHTGAAVVIEPDADVRAIHDLALARAGYRVVSAADGRTGLRLINRVVPDLVVTEIILPWLDGFQLARRLRSQEKTRNITIVAVTSYSGDDLNARAVESGITAVLRKPGDIYDLLRVVRRTVSNSRDLQMQSQMLRRELHSEVERTRRLLLRTRTREHLGESKPDRPTDRVEPDQTPVDEEMLSEADGARDLMIVDPARGEGLFALLLKRYEQHPIFYFKRGEAYRALGRRKLAHADFAVAAGRMPNGAWRERMVLAAMRSRSHHD